MKKFILSLLMAVSLIGSDLIIHMGSKHFVEEADEFNEINPGLGIRTNFFSSSYLEGGFYVNSYSSFDNPSVSPYVKYGFSKFENYSNDWFTSRPIAGIAYYGESTPYDGEVLPFVGVEGEVQFSKKFSLIGSLLINGLATVSLRHQDLDIYNTLTGK